MEYTDKQQRNGVDAPVESNAKQVWQETQAAYAESTGAAKPKPATASLPPRHPDGSGRFTAPQPGKD